MNRSNGATDSRLRVGLVGLGNWGPNLVRVLAETPSVSVEWICDLLPERVDRAARTFPGPRATTSFERMLDDPSLEAVAIATPVWTHEELATQALEAGKHVLVEKPLAASSEAVDNLLEVAASRDLVLMCGHTFLYSPPVRSVKDLLDHAELGDLYFISSSRVNLGLHQRDVSVIWDLGPHDFSILRYWLDEVPQSISAFGRDSVVNGVPDVAFLTLNYPEATLVHVELSWLAPSKLRRTVLVGSEKMVVYEDGGPEPVRIFNHGVEYRDPETFGEYHLAYRTGEIVSPKVASDEPLALEAQAFVDAVRAGAPPRGHDSLCRDVVRMVEAAEASLHLGGAPVEVAERGRLAASR